MPSTQVFAPSWSRRRRTIFRSRVGLAIAMFQQDAADRRGDSLGLPTQSKVRVRRSPAPQNGCGRLSSGDKRPAAVQLTQVRGTVGTGLASTSILEIGAAAVFWSSAAASSNLLYVAATRHTAAKLLSHDEAQRIAPTLLSWRPARVGLTVRDGAYFIPCKDCCWLHNASASSSQQRSA